MMNPALMFLPLMAHQARKRREEEQQEKRDRKHEKKMKKLKEDTDEKHREFVRKSEILNRGLKAMADNVAWINEQSIKDARKKDQLKDFDIYDNLVD